MSQHVLLNRIRALEQELDKAKTSKWVKDAGVGQVDLLEDVWDGLDATIGREARVHGTELAKLRATVEEVEPDDASTLQDAWTTYAQIYEQTKDLFGELLEFVGGLAFRDAGLHGQRTFQIADELIRTCSRLTSGNPWQSVTIPARQETEKMTLARIIGLRFPDLTTELSIWSLPLTAHEFGHVLVEGDEAIRPLIARQAKSPRRWRIGSRGKAMTGRTATNHLNELAADAFATYHMGPAYACAAIHLRLNPWDGDKEDEHHPADRKRAHVVLSMLRLLNEEGSTRSYQQVLDRLTSDWTAMLKLAGSDELDDGICEQLDQFVKLVWDQFGVFRSTAKYPKVGDNGFTVAQTWQNGWEEQIGAGLLVPAVTKASKLRDALNAGWMFRLSKPDQLREISRVLTMLCESILEKYTEQEPGRLPGARAI